MKTAKTLTSLTVLLFLFSLTAQAQHVGVAPASEAPLAWRAYIGEQLAGSLQSPVTEVRHNALELVIHLATYRGGEVDLSATVPVLLSIYRSDPDERCRLAAVAGLHALGDESALRQLRQGVHRQPSERVQLATLGALRAFYGPAAFEDDPTIARLAEALREHASDAEPVVASDH